MKFEMDPLEQTVSVGVWLKLMINFLFVGLSLNSFQQFLRLKHYQYRTSGNLLMQSQLAFLKG